MVNEGHHVARGQPDDAEWVDGQYQVEEIPGVPIIATWNDFSRLYAGRRK